MFSFWYEVLWQSWVKKSKPLMLTKFKQKKKKKKKQDQNTKKLKSPSSVFWKTMRRWHPQHDTSKAPWNQVLVLMTSTSLSLNLSWQCLPCYMLSLVKPVPKILIGRHVCSVWKNESKIQVGFLFVNQREKLSPRLSMTEIREMLHKRITAYETVD